MKMSHKPNNVTSPGLGITGYAPGARPGGLTRRASGDRAQPEQLRDYSK